MFTPMTHRSLAYFTVLFIAVVFSGCVTQKDKAIAEGTAVLKKAEKVYAAYSVLAPSATGTTILYARVIVDGTNTHCPTLTSSAGVTIPTHPRGLHPDAGNATQNFPVTLCEAIISPDTAYTDLSGIVNLQAVTLSPSAVLVYGDSGCKSKKCKPGNPSKHFKKLAKVGIQEHPQLILHMGDFNYRGTSGSIAKGVYAYDAGDGGFGGASCGFNSTYNSQNSSGSPRPDTWQYWYEDFFLPAKDLLPIAPWIFARGNHELCSRAGVGWFYFLGPGSSLKGGIAQMQCPNQGCYSNPPPRPASHIIMFPPYAVELNEVRVWVMDSANACDASAANPLTVQYQAQFEQLQTNSQGKNTWMMTHRPLWGINSTAPGNAINIMMQTALANTPMKSLPSSVSLSFSGHMHIYQSLDFPNNSARPPQIIIGNSGVSLEKHGVVGDFSSVQVDGQNASGNGMNIYGFLSMKLQPNGTWTGDILDSSGKAFVTCGTQTLATNKSICVLDQS